ncbi:aminotransferase class V-fold PLP-dependent enzyme [Algoriphagus sp.]|uniref:aminotransferase class V-fold PLP-dependent enzyme n=1 Tax=Algoriphagus sp. TaxID=1872435 RepID=UPI003918DDCC
MKSRRNFIQKISAGIAIPSLLGIQATYASEPFEINHSLESEDFWEQIRTQFPLSTDRVYLNNGTFGPAPFPVLKAMEKSNLHINTTGEYGNSDQERSNLAEFFGIKATEFSITHNTTEGINIMAWGVPLQAGDEVILTTHEHAGNALPWLNRAKLDGIVLRTFEPKTTGEENLNEIQKLINPRTKVIAIPHVTCTTGLVFPIKEICELARKNGILTAIDGAHGAGSFDLNLYDLGCDFYAGCFHKWMCGPSGTAFLFVREDALEKLKAVMIGGHSDIGWDMTVNPPEFKGYVPSARRFDYGTQSKTLAVGMLAAADFHSEIGKGKIESRVRELNQYLFEGLSGLASKLEILTPLEKESRIAIISFRPKNMDFNACGAELGKAGFRVRLVHEGKVNAVRISTHIYNSKAELDNFLGALDQILA